MNIRRIATLMTAGVLALGAAACSDDESDSRTRDTAGTDTGVSQTTDTGTGTDTTGTDTTGTDTTGFDPTGQESLLQDYVALENSQLETLLEQMDAEGGADLYNSATVVGEPLSNGSQVVYTYQYSESSGMTVDAGSVFDGQVDSIRVPANSTVFPTMRQMGLEGSLYLNYVYLTADGSEIWNYTLMEDTTGAQCDFTTPETLPNSCSDV